VAPCVFFALTVCLFIHFFLSFFDISKVILDDISWANELSFQSFGPPNTTNITFFVYGDSRVRTVYPGPNFYVGQTPNENWHLPFIDFHTFQNGSDIWGIGPVNPIFARDRGAYSGFQFEIAVVTTKVNQYNPRGRIFVEQPLGFEGTFYGVHVVSFDIWNTIGYFVGFFPPNSSAPGVLNFGVRRAHFNTTLFDGNQPYNTSNDAWYFDSAIDDCVVYPNAQLVTYNNDFRPMLLHARNITTNPPAPVNSTYIVVVDPYTNYVTLLRANYDPKVPVTRTGFQYLPVFQNFQVGHVVSAVVWDQLLFVGVAVDGIGTGWIDVLYLANLTRKANSIYLPANYSDPRALVLDFFHPTPTIYIGMNGGRSILKFDIMSLKIVGYQTLPEYLHRTWRGQPTHEHLYFITNEQHSKVYRVSKRDFCPNECMAFGYCSKGQCVCGPNLVMKGNSCQWKEVVHEKEVAKKDQGGEIALGIFFALATVAAGAGWYLVWKNRRGYQSVA